MLTAAQLPTLKAAIVAETDPAFVTLRNAGATGAMAEFYNVEATPTFLLWRKDAPVDAINDAINWALYTPVDPIDALALFTNRVLVIQTKQMNLQNMLIGRASVDATRSNIRAGLRDAVIQVPAGAGGGNVSPGGASGAVVLSACTRPATRGEKLYAGAPVTTGSTSASIPTHEGGITNDDVVRALALP